MTSRLYSTLDPAAAGPGLFVKEGNLIASTTLSALDIHRSIHGTLGVTQGSYYYEVYYWTTSRTSLANLVSFGITQPQGLLNKYVGEETVSYGWRFADDGVYNNNAKIATVAAYPERTSFGCYLFLSGGSCTLTFCVNAVALATIALPTGKTWLPAFTLSGAVAGDEIIQVNFGQSLFDNPLPFSINSLGTPPPVGWYQQSPGLATLYLSKATEGFMSAHTDTPADQSYSPRVLNAEQFSIKRAPLHWVHRTSSIDKTPVPSAFATLSLDNSKGDFNALLLSDARDSPVTMDYLAAPAMGFGTNTVATRMFTANIAAVSAPDANTVAVTLRGNLDRLDVAMKAHLIPAYYDQSNAGKAMPFGIGTQRNFNPVLLDQPGLIYLLGDIPYSDIPLVMDNAAPLDPLVPQWTAALSGKAIQLTNPPVGKLSCDASTVGPQYVAGITDVLAGSGAFTTWTTGVPNGWTKAANPPWPALVVANGSLTQTSSYGTTSALMMISNVPYSPTFGYFGYPITHSTFIFQPGRTYRITFHLLAATGVGTENYGFAIVAGAADNAQYWITDFRNPLRQPGQYSYEFNVPASLGALPLALFSISKMGGTAPTTQTSVIVVDDLVIEQLGQFQSVPMFGATLDSATQQVLVTHQGESTSIYSSTDAQAVQNGTVSRGDMGYVLGMRFTEPPNCCDAIQTYLDNFGAVMFEDENNVIRYRVLTAPENGTPVALFDTSNVEPETFSVAPDEAPSLTTLWGARPNCDPNGDSDFVSDTAIATPAAKAALTGACQFNLSSTVQPAQEYSFAQNAPRFITQFDDPDQCLREANRVVGIWSQRYVGGVLSNGKRRVVTFTANFDGLTLGAGPSVQPQQLYYGDVVTINLPREGLNNVQGAVISTELFPFAGKITLEVLV